MKRALLAKMERMIANKIAAKKELDEKYDFMEIKRSVLNMHVAELGEERDAYSSELSKRFTMRK
jgi:hypothetical protein